LYVTSKAGNTAHPDARFGQATDDAAAATSTSHHAFISIADLTFHPDYATT